MQFNVGKGFALFPNITLVPLSTKVPLLELIVPEVIVVEEVEVRVFEPIFNVPLVTTSFPTVVLAVNAQLFGLDTIVTESDAPGTPLGVQFAAVVQAVEAEPFHE
jgi:hypothetical protein